MHADAPVLCCVCCDVLCYDVLSMQLAEVREVISSQCGAAATLLVRAVPAGQQLAPDTAAVTVLLTCPASPGGGSSQQAATAHRL